MNAKAKLIVSKDSVNETSGIFLRQAYLRFLIMAVISSAIIAALIPIITRNSSKAIKLITTIIELVAIVTIIIICITRALLMRRKFIAQMQAQVETVYHTDYIEKEVIFDCDKIKCTDPDGSAKTFYKSDVMKAVETTSYVVLLLKGNIQLNILKTSLEGMSAEQLIAENSQK